MLVGLTYTIYGEMGKGINSSFPARIQSDGLLYAIFGELEKGIVRMVSVVAVYPTFEKVFLHTAFFKGRREKL